MFKSNKGFTLVELIVVIAILAILAGVAIPVYNGYIKRAQDASVTTELDAIATAAQAANATEGGIDLIVVSADGKSIKVSGADDNTVSKNFNEDFILFYGKAGVTAVSGKYGQFTITETEKIDMAGSYTDKGANWTKADGWKTDVVSIDDNKIPGATQTPSVTPPTQEETEQQKNCKHENVVNDDAVPATCTTTGLTAGSHCGDCQKVLTAQTVVEKLDHTYVDGKCTCGATQTTTPSTGGNQTPFN